MNKTRDDIIEYYQIKIDEKTLLIDNLTKRSKRVSNLRLISFLLSLIFLFTFSYWYNIAISGFFLVLFLFFRRKDIELEKASYINKREKDAIENELSVTKDHKYEFENGCEFIDKGHNYSDDLDIVGENSLFQYINRTVTKFGKETLYKWLKSSADINEILLRQKAIKEISLLPDLIIAFISNANNKKDFVDMEYLVGQMQKISFKSWRITVTLALSIINVAVLVLFAINFVSLYFLFLVLALNYFVVYILLWKSHFKYHEKFKRCSQELFRFADLFRFIENQKFSSDKLLEIKSTITVTSNNVSGLFIILARINKRLDYRLNMAFQLIINSFIYFDVHQINLLYHWFKRNKDYVNPCFNALGEFEVLISFANLYYSNPQWAFPSISKDKNICIFKDVGHPLLPHINRVTNNFCLNEGFTIITGSNMAGKSTFLRTIGVNIVLGLAGAPICASESVIPCLKVITLMRVQDSLIENVSTFQAELQRIKKILNISNDGNETLVILDEPLKGTNSTDRYFGTRALIHKLVQSNIIGMLATHDLKLTTITEDFPDKISNYHFDINMVGNKLEFDYKLKTGVCTSSNAKYLIEELGLKYVG